jgi:hypothetical protein
MLEIIILYRLTREIGARVTEKGYKPGLFKFLTVIFWIVFEMIGAFFGILLFSGGFLTYLCGLIGAIFGYFLINVIVRRLEVIRFKQLK